MGFEYPQALLLGPLALGLWWFRQQRKRPTAVNFAPAALFASELQPGSTQKYLPRILAYAALTCLILACANYRYADIQQQSQRESRWLMLVQDLSGSMYRPSGGEPGETLGDVSLDGINSFIKQRPEEDMIGLVAFSSVARLLAPLTFDRRILYDKLDQLDRKNASRISRQLAVGGATNASYAVWLAMCSFFMMRPKDTRPAFAELKDLRYLLAGSNRNPVTVPAKFRDLGREGGTAIILFTDGRIKATHSNPRNREQGLPDFISLIDFLERVGIRLYIIAVDGKVESDIAKAMDSTPGRLFLMPGHINKIAMRKIYDEINTLEKNRLLNISTTVPRSTRPGFMLAALSLLTLFGIIKITPGYSHW